MQEIYKRNNIKFYLENHVLILHMYVSAVWLLFDFSTGFYQKNVTKQLKNKQNTKIFLISTPNIKYCFLHS